MADSETEEEVILEPLIIAPLKPSDDEPTTELVISGTSNEPATVTAATVSEPVPEPAKASEGGVPASAPLHEALRLMSTLAWSHGLGSIDLGVDRESFYRIAGECSAEERDIDARRYGPEELRLRSAVFGITRVYIRGSR